MKVFTLSIYFCALVASMYAFADDPKVTELPFFKTTGDQTSFVKNLNSEPKAKIELAAGYMTLTYQSNEGERHLTAKANDLSLPEDGDCTHTYQAAFESDESGTEPILATYMAVSNNPNCANDPQVKAGESLTVSTWGTDATTGKRVMAMVLFEQYVPKSPMSVAQSIYYWLSSRFNP